MTWITDNSGTRWVEVPQRKRRKPRTGGRFSELSIGDQLVQRTPYTRIRPHEPERAPYEQYVQVTDLWFDPVAGQDNEWRGQMVGVAAININGALSKKQSYSRHALAAVGYHRAEIDYRGMCVARAQAARDGAVVSIRHAHKIRSRPKLPGGL